MERGCWLPSHLDAKGLGSQVEPWIKRLGWSSCVLFLAYYLYNSEPSGSVDFDLDSANPVGSKIVDERTDHGSDAADDSIDDGAQDHGHQLPVIRELSTAYLNS
jgi:hypothetical protein